MISSDYSQDVLYGKPKVEILLWTVQMYYGRANFIMNGQDILWKVEILLLMVHKYYERSRFYY